MTNRAFSSRNAFLAAGLMLMMPVSVMAQDSAPTFPPTKIIVTGADGKTAEYLASDASVYVSTTPAYDDIPATTDFSLSLTVTSPIDATLLQWAAQGNSETEAQRDLEIVATVKDAAGADREIQYKVDGAHVTSISTSHSTYAQSTVSLQVSAKALAIDGVSMK